MTDYPDWQDATAYAAAIATGNPGGAPGGVPLLHATAALINTTLANIAAAGSASTGTANTTQIGYECFISIANHTSLVAASYAQITFTWTDTTSGQVVLTERWIVNAGPHGTPHTLKGRGPSGANQLQVTVNNHSTSADAIDAVVLVISSSSIFTRSDMRTDSLQSANFTTTAADLAADIVGSMSPAVLGSGGTWTRVLPLYAGQVNLSALTSSGAADGEFTVQAVAPVFAMTNDQVILDKFTDAKGDLFQGLAFPRFQQVLIAQNHNAGTFGLSATLVVVETET